MFSSQALGIESEDDLYKLVNFFLRYRSHRLSSIQVGQGTAGERVLVSPEVLLPHGVLSMTRALCSDKAHPSTMSSALVAIWGIW